MSSTNHLPWRFAGNHNTSNTLAGSSTAKRAQQEGRNRAGHCIFFGRKVECPWYVGSYPSLFALPVPQPVRHWWNGD